MDPDSQLLVSFQKFDASLSNRSAIEGLPPELILIIFGFMDSQFKNRMVLTHVCQEWRTTSLQNATLWTDISIKAGRNIDKDAFDNLISLLSMQLSRTGDLPLDVRWFSSANIYLHGRIVHLLREMAPFSRWRTLTIRVEGIQSNNVIFPLPEDKFPILESLMVFGWPHKYLVDTIDRTATSSLKLLDLRYLRTTTISAYDDLISNHISSLVLPSILMPITDVEVPPNVIELEADTRRKHHFPYITTYRVSLCIFTLLHPPYLPNLTTLIVTSSLDLFGKCQITIPSLLHLECATITLAEGATFHTPALESFHLCASYSRPVNVNRMNTFSKTVRNLGFKLAPRTSITIDLCLRVQDLRTLLQASPHLERASLSFESHDEASKLLRDFESSGTPETELQEGDAMPLGWRLTELRLSFECELEDVAFWKSWALSVVSQRKATGIALSIYGSWKGEGACIRLG